MLSILYYLIPSQVLILISICNKLHDIIEIICRNITISKTYHNVTKPLINVAMQHNYGKCHITTKRLLTSQRDRTLV